MNLAPFKTRLEEAAPLLRDVLVAATGPIGLDDIRRHPAAVVAPFRTVTSANPYGTQITSQEMVEEVTITVVVKNLSDARGGAAAVDLDAIVKQVRSALIGWRHPDAAGDPTEHAGGQIVPFARSTGALGWLDRYRYPHTHRTTEAPT